MRVLKVIYVMAIAAAIIALVATGVHAFYAVDPSSWEYLELHARTVFFVVLPLGMAFAVGGTFLQKRTSIFGAALIVGGMGTMIFAVTPYHLDGILGFIGIAVILAVLIFVGNRIFRSLRRS